MVIVSISLSSSSPNSFKIILSVVGSLVGLVSKVLSISTHQLAPIISASLITDHVTAPLTRYQMVTHVFAHGASGHGIVYSPLLHDVVRPHELINVNHNGVVSIN